MKSLFLTSLSFSFLALVSACGGVTVDYTMRPVSQPIRLQVGQELRSATITTFSVSVDSATLQDGDNVLGEVIAEQEAATVENSDSSLAFSQGRVIPGIIDRLVVTFGDASPDTAKQADNQALSGFAFLVEGTIDIDPNVPGEETPLLIRIKAPEEPVALLLPKTNIEDENTQLSIDTPFSLQSFLNLADYAPLKNGDSIFIDDETNPDAAQEIQDNLKAALSIPTTLGIDD